MSCLIYDFETLSVDPNTGVAVNLAMLSFDMERFTSDPYTFEWLVDDCKIIKFNVEEQIKKYKRTVDQDTLRWWGQQSKEAQAILKPSADDVSITELFDFFVSNVPDNLDRVYTRRASLDQPMMISLCEIAGKTLPYSWWSFREIVSFIEGLTMGSGLRDDFIPEGLESKFIKHDPAHDIAMDVMRLQTIVQALQ